MNGAHARAQIGPDKLVAGIITFFLISMLGVFAADHRKGHHLDREKKTLFVSQVFKFDKKHLESLGGGTLTFILPFLTQQDRQYLTKEKVTLEYLDYNWRPNDIKNAE